jgi:hypothetical protein
MARSRSNAVRSSAPVHVKPRRTLSAPPSTLSTWRVHANGAGQPPAKAPPPTPVNHHQFIEQWRRTRQVIPVRFAATGSTLSELAVDFTHTVVQVEQAILYYHGVRAKLFEPLPTSSSDRIFSLCFAHYGIGDAWELKVLVSPTRSFSGDEFVHRSR